MKLIKRKIISFVMASILLTTTAYAVNSNTPQSISPFLPNTVSEHYVRVNGVKLHYLEAGHGPLVILLHGWPETSLAWHNTIAALMPYYHVVAPDLRGLGQSEHTKTGYDKKTIATDIKALIESFGEKHAIIIAHDMGGKAAYMMAHLYPQMISRLVLADCFIPGTENADPYQGGSWHYGFHMAKDFPETLTKDREKEYISTMIKLMSYKKDAISDDMINEYVSNYASPGGMTAGFNYYRALKEDAELAKTFRTEKLSMPILTITGEYSAKDKLANALKNEAINLKSIIVKESGHFVAEEQPEVFNQALLHFLSNDNADKLKSLEKENQGTLGIYVFDTNTNKSVNYHADKRFPFCSTFKVLLVSAILKQSETQPSLLQEKLFFTKKEIKEAGYSPITQQYINDGMTISELCAAAIMYSDNGAANLLIKKLGGLNQVNTFAQSIADNTFRIDRFEPELNTAIPSDLRDTTTPIMMAKDLEKLLLGNTLAPYQQNLLRTWLEHNTTGDLRIRASIPKDWIVADKTGTGEYGTTNGIAILWPPNGKPIILVIYFTQYQKDAKAKDEVVAKATKVVLNELNA